MSQLIGMVVSLFTFVVILFIVAVALIAPQYNRLKTLAEGVLESLSNILVSMQKRADLANKLQEIASTYAKDEQFTMIAIAKEDSVGRIVDAYRDSLQAINIVHSVAQRYPQIKSDVLYQNLRHQLTLLEQELQARREQYNACVRAYNSPLKQFPTLLYAPAVGLEEAPYWQADDVEALGRLKEFKTDDDRVRVLMANMGNRAADMTKQGMAVVKSKVEAAQAVRKNPGDNSEARSLSNEEKESTGLF